MEPVSTLIIGAGQAGLALSRRLSDAGQDHVLLERGQIGERWRSERWESLSLLTPNWLNVLPGSDAHADPHGFLRARELISYLEHYAASFSAPVLERTTVLEVRRSGNGYKVRTTAGNWAARNVVLATGDCDTPALPRIAADTPVGTRSLHASRYRRPSALPSGAALVVGAGPSGQQIAAELRRAGRDVVLAAGGHARVPRRYRGRDIFDWLRMSGALDRTLDEVPDPGAAKRARSLPLSGAGGGEQIDLAVLRGLGVVIAGRLTGFRGTEALFADDLPESVGAAEDRMRRLIGRLDAFATETDEPAEPIPPVELPAGPRSLDLGGFGSVVWATGYRRTYPWLRVPVLDESGEVIQRRGATPAPGLYTLGFKFQWRRRSHFIGGVGDDAAYLAERIVEP
jgi:putative flavoprotein involved in K+ transport